MIIKIDHKVHVLVNEFYAISMTLHPSLSKEVVEQKVSMIGS